MGWLRRRRLAAREQRDRAVERDFEEAQARIRALRQELDVVASRQRGWRRGEREDDGWYFQSHAGHVATLQVGESREPGDYTPCLYLQVRLSDWDFVRDGPPRVVVLTEPTIQEALEYAESMAIAPAPGWRREDDAARSETPAREPSTPPEDSKIVDDVMKHIFRPRDDSSNDAV